MKRSVALWIAVVVILMALTACKEKKAEEGVDLQKAAEEFIQTAQKGDVAKLEGLMMSKYKSKVAYEVERFQHNFRLQIQGEERGEGVGGNLVSLHVHLPAKEG